MKVLPLFFGTRKNLFFLCLSVASVVFFPNYSYSSSAELLDEWSENFESYNLGNALAGQDGWISNATSSNSSIEIKTDGAWSAHKYFVGSDHTESVSWYHYKYFLLDLLEFQYVNVTADFYLTDSIEAQSAEIYVETSAGDDVCMFGIEKTSSGTTTPQLFGTLGGVNTNYDYPELEVLSEGWHTFTLELDNANEKCRLVTSATTTGWLDYDDDGPIIDITRLNIAFADDTNGTEEMKGIDNIYVEVSGLNLGFVDPSSFDTVTNTRFYDLTATGGTVTANFYIDPTEVNRSISAFNPTDVRFQYSKQPSTDYSGIGVSIGTTTGTSSASYNFSSLADGTYDFRASFSNGGCSIGLSDCPFPNTAIYNTFTIASGTITLGPNEIINGIDDSGSQGGTFFDVIKDFFLNILVTKHPFAWVYETLYIIRSTASTQQENQDFSITLDFAPQITNATSSNGFIDFYSFKNSLSASGLDDYELSPIADACTALNGTIDFCDTFRTLINYMIWLALIYFYGTLLYKFINPETE